MLASCKARSAKMTVNRDEEDIERVSKDIGHTLVDINTYNGARKFGGYKPSVVCRLAIYFRSMYWS